jgi:hypothetical protein
MAFETATIDLPSFLAVALINGDVSGFTDEEEETLEMVYNMVKDQYGQNASIVDVSEDTFFAKWYDGDGLGHDMATYTILVSLN